MESNELPASVQLTPAAKELLDEYAEEYKRRLLSEAKRTATRDEGSSVSMGDIRSAEFAVSRIQGDNRSLWQRYRSIVLTVLSVIAGIALGGLTSLVTAPAPVAGSSTNTLPLTLVILAATAAVTFGVGIVVWQYRGSDSAAIGTRDFLIDVAGLEREARELASDLTGAQLNSSSLSRVIDTLEDRNVWTTADVAAFQDIMKLRNRFVYEQRSSGSSGKDILRASHVIRRLRESLRAYEQENSSPRRRSSHRSAVVLEHEVQKALSQTLSVSLTPSRDVGADFLVALQGATVAVVLKSAGGRRIGLKELKDWLPQSEDTTLGTVVVTDGDLSTDLVDVGSVQLDDGRPVRVVRWEGSVSAPLLLRAIMRVADDGLKNRGVQRI